MNLWPQAQSVLSRIATSEAQVQGTQPRERVLAGLVSPVEEPGAIKRARSAPVREEQGHHGVGNEMDHEMIDPLFHCVSRPTSRPAVRLAADVS